jgi:hypothetical protein
MRKRILIGSIIAVTLLISVIFTSVVGYYKVDSNLKPSPLFAVRSSRAIDEENQELVCDYVGKGNYLLFPKRDDKTVLIQKFINNIGRMDDAIYNRFLNLLINQIQEKYEYDDINEAINTIQQIRDNHQTIIVDESKNSISTFRFEFTPTMCWFPGCIPLLTIGYIIQGILIVATLIWLLFNPCTTSRTCTMN